MIPFPHPALHFLYPAALLLLLPLALVAFWLARPGQAAAVAYSSAELVRSVASGRRTRWGRFVPALRWLGAALVIVALARPSIEHRNVTVQASGVDIVLAVDVSGSMQARDMVTTSASEPISRLDAAKEVVSRFVQARPNDRIGLVAFAGEPYLASPLTLDHDWVLQNVARLDPSQLGDGTAIGSAIAAGVRRLDAKGAKSRILIVLTDGQNNAGKIQPNVAAEAARALGVKIYAIGVGSTGEALVPVSDDHGHEQLVQARVDVDEPAMRRVAELTGGKFYRATDTKSLSDVYADIDRFEKTTRTAEIFTRHDERFAWFAVPGLALVLAQLGLSATRFRRVP
ncbi:MAG TPA: VWA domain-containing protein [Polyangiaceae bacterium]|jgi:Ca-activated chloride channel family protein